MFTRNRPWCGNEYDRSAEPCSFKVSYACLFWPSRSPTIRAVSSAVSFGNSGIGTATSLPDTSTCGGRPGEIIRSLTPFAKFSMVEMTCAVGIADFCGEVAAAVAAGAPFAGTVPDVDMNPPFLTPMLFFLRGASPAQLGAAYQQRWRGVRKGNPMRYR